MKRQLSSFGLETGLGARIELTRESPDGNDSFRARGDTPPHKKSRAVYQVGEGNYQ